MNCYRCGEDKPLSVRVTYTTTTPYHVVHTVQLCESCGSFVGAAIDGRPLGTAGELFPKFTIGTGSEITRREIVDDKADPERGSKD